MMKRRAFELSDVARLAYPSIERMDIGLTAANISEAMSGKSFLNYGPVFARMTDLVKGTFSITDCESTFNFYKAAWKNAELLAIASLLHAEFSGRGTWYKAGVRPIEILPSAFFKPSIKGNWFFEGSSYSVSVNARKLQPWSYAHQRFIARGVDVLHCADDPNDPVPMTIDLSLNGGATRQLRRRVFSSSEMMSADEFESVLGKFFLALEKAGVTSVPDNVASYTDMLRRTR